MVRLENNLRLRLGHVDDGARHASDEDHASRALALHQVLGDGDSEEVCTVHVNAPKLAHTVDRVIDSIVVFGEPCAGDEVVDLSVLLNDLVDAALHRVGIRHVGVVSGHLRHSMRAGVFLPEYLNQLNGLALGFLFCLVGKELSVFAFIVAHDTPQVSISHACGD